MHEPHALGNIETTSFFVVDTTGHRITILRIRTASRIVSIDLLLFYVAA